MSSMAHYQQRHHHPQLSHQIAKATTAVTLGASLMVLSGVTMTATILGLIVITPLLLIVSPVLVPAVFTFFMILAGLATSGGLGVTASYVCYWLYRYVSGKHPLGADRLDWARQRIAGAAVDIRHKAQQLGEQTGKEGGSYNH